MMNFFNKFSLKVRITAFSILSVCLIVLVSMVMFSKFNHKSAELLEESLVGYAESLQAAVSAQFFERYGDVQAFSINPDIKSINKDTIVNALNSYVIMYGIYDLIMVVDSQGRLVASNNKSPSGQDLDTAFLYSQNYADTPWFKAALNGEFTSDKEKGYTGTYVEDANLDPYISKVYGSNVWANSFSTQIKDSSGRVIGVITNRANFKWVDAETQNVASQLPRSFDHGMQVMVLNKNNVVISAATKETHDSKVEISRDYEGTVGKINISEEHTDLADLLQKEEGFMLSKDKEKGGINQIVAYSKFTDPKWISSVGWQAMVHLEEDVALAGLNEISMQFYIGVFGIFILVVGFSLYFSGQISSTLSQLAHSFDHEASSLVEDSASMASTSDQLSSAATEQAAALQETVSAIDEVSAMISKNAENARKSKEISQSSEKSAIQGKKSMDEMIQVIDEIHKSNTEMMEQIKKSNEEFTNVVNVINEIGSKTKVINDIVFQTKLLSFNASVEAARAGAHGKGFAVVAEEVGNLAQMSGNAAKEITSLLESSVVKVEMIVMDTKSRVDRLVDEGKVKVEAGIKTAQSCSDSLEEIVASVSQVNQMVEEISTASNEQAQGVSEITKAMNQLDQVTQQNTSAASMSSDTAVAVKDKAANFKANVGVFLEAVFGFGKTTSGELTSANTEVSSKKVKSSGKILQMKKEQKPSYQTKMAKQEESLMKKASGDDVAVPHKDDPRFEDI